MLDVDSYISNFYHRNYSTIAKAPTYKYSNMNFSRLSADRKQLVADITVEFPNNLFLTETIEWDLNDHLKSPVKFAKLLCDKLKGQFDDRLYKKNLETIERQLFDQMLSHVDKNTFFPRMRLLKRENEGATNQLVKD